VKDIFQGFGGICEILFCLLGRKCERRRNDHRLFNAAKNSVNWTDYKSTLTDYNKVFIHVKRELWKRHCEEIENAPDCARLQRILSKDGQSAVNSLQLENGEYTTTEKRTWKCYSGSTSLVLNLSWNLLEAGSVLNWIFRNRKDPGKTRRFSEGS
jgi:hypothetical protein